MAGPVMPRREGSHQRLATSPRCPAAPSMWLTRDRLEEPMDPERAASIPLLAGLDRRALEQVLRTAREQTYAPGEVVVNEGDPATRLYLIVDGTATAEQGGKTVGRIETGEFF